MPLLVKVTSCTADQPKSKGPRLQGTMQISIIPGTEAFKIYGKEQVAELFSCNYELNPEYKNRLVTSGLTVSGLSADGHARIIEVHNKRFFIGTGFLPQLNSTPENPHPLILAFLKAAGQIT
jgi:CTP synthase (UTP-ammonia lyase)